jgi:hypothetical protein
MSTQRVKEILRQAALLTDHEKVFLAQQLLEQAQTGQPVMPTPISAPGPSRQQQLNWLKAHQAEYADQYVALVGEQLIATGSTYQEAAEAAGRAGAADAMIVHVPHPQQEYFAGW